MRGYLLLVSQSSSIDRESNAPSFFTLVERVTIVPYQPERPVALEVHAHFEVGPEDVEHILETRIVWLAADGSAWRSGKVIAINPNAVGRLRIRANTLALPPAPGDYHIQVEGRRPEDADWQRISPSFPISILTDAPQSVPPQTSV